jgi:hypothetical protein
MATNGSDELNGKRIVMPKSNFIRKAARGMTQAKKKASSSQNRKEPPTVLTHVEQHPRTTTIVPSS